MSFKTIYRWIYAGILTCGVSVLRQKGKRRKPQEKRGKFLVGTSIHKRPKSAKKRMEIGHWEADTMVSSRGKSKGCFATFPGRRSRLYLAVKIPSRSAKSMEKTINWLIETLGKDYVRSITTDRGKEFACYKQIDKRGVPVYFADPYCAWQRGTNENCNGLLREFFPKKTDLAKIDEYELVDALIKINQRPRKCLYWKTPIELFQKEVLHLI